jgi:hypothetical protein
VLFLTVGVLIGLGAFGHSFMGRLAVDAELGKFAIAPAVATMLYVVWYFVGGCMALFAFTAVWASYRQRKGDVSLLFITALIGVLYFATGLGGFLCRRGDPFMLVFVTEGALLVAASFVLSRRAATPVGKATASIPESQGRRRRRTAA